MKLFIYLGATVGGIVGSFVPALWGGSLFDFPSIIVGSVCTMGGAVVGYKLGKYFDL